MKYNLKNKKILITGSSGGIGKSLCYKFIENECILICTTTTSDKIVNLQNEFGPNHFYYKLDLSNTSKIIDNIDMILDKHKNIDILINNAGLTRDNLLLRMNNDQWNDVINVNLNSNFYILKKILPSMIKNKNGCIIGVSSIVALTGNPGQVNYAASKSAMIAMYKSLALEVAQRNIRVNVIAPGFIQTPMTEKLDETQKNLLLKKIPMKKLGVPSDIANIAAFLASDQASYITGQTINIDGGIN